MTAPEPLRRQILDAFGLTEDDVTIGFESMDAAEVAAHQMEDDYRAALPGRMAEVAAELSAVLPAGLRLEVTVTPPPTAADELMRQFLEEYGRALDANVESALRDGKWLDGRPAR